MNYVADTHALLWHFTDSPKISSRALALFAACERGECVIFIPTIVIAESLSIFDKKKLSFDFKKLLKMIHESENFLLIPLDYPILQKMIDLKEIPELHDKIIVSTAKYLNVTIITKDEMIRSVDHIKTVW
jgi:PIN domain nuclease of toxin-antitoxin system